MNVEIFGPPGPRHEEVLTPKALDFVAALHERFDDRRMALLKARRTRQIAFDNGDRPDFLPDTSEARSGDWRVAPPATDLTDRRVEITGPVERKMMINALNSG
ncbi:MAG: malate synthase A, partial [Acidimicrobiia bacterium]